MSGKFINNYMAFTVNRNLDKMTVRAGEPMYFVFQDCSAAGTPFPVDGKQYIWSLYTSSALLQRFTARLIVGGSPKAVWELPGTVSEGLRDTAGIKFEIAEVLDDGREVITIGDLAILEASPGSLDNDGRPKAKYYQFTRRLNDAATIEAPVFESAIKSIAELEAPALPAFSAVPVISGSAIVGQVLTATDGTATAPISARQWLLNGAAISGATGSAYTPATTGSYTFRLTATNSTGSVSATSAATSVAAAPTPAPVFTTAPSVSPSTGTVGQVFTATSGTASNASTYAGQWLLNGTAISGATATTYTSTATGSLTYCSTATGAGGSTSATTSAVTVAAAATPSPVFTAQPTISPASGNVGQVFTATSGTASNASTYAGQWYLGGVAISGATALTYTSTAAGSLTYTSTATGSGGSVSATTSAATVAAPAATFTLNRLVVEGSSSTSNTPDSAASDPGDSLSLYPYKFRALHPEKYIRIRGQSGRVNGTVLDDGQNTMMGHVSEDASFTPDAIFAMCFANDFGSISDATCRANVTALYNEYKTRGIKFIFSPPAPLNPIANPLHQSYTNHVTNRDSFMAAWRDPAVSGKFSDYLCPLGEHPIFVDDPASAYNGDQIHAAAAGQAAYLTVFRAYMETMFDASRVTSQTVYSSVWPADQTALPKNTSTKIYVVVAGLAHKGASIVASVSGGDAKIRRGQGSFATSIPASSTSPLLNGDVLTIQVTTRVRTR